jgi:neutral ceramidase
MRYSALLASTLCLGCPAEEEPKYVPVPLVAGAPQAGVYNGFLRLPAGVPMGGYTSRDAAFGGTRTRPTDLRSSPWTHKFHPSAGQLTGVPLQALWLTNGDRNMVLLRVDLIGSFDGLVEEVTRQLEQATGEDLEHSVFIATSHSHSAPAAFHNSLQFALGFDRFDPRVAQRVTRQATEAALVARGQLAPAQIGMGVMPDFDPREENRIYRDRRSVNDHLPDFYGQPTGPGFKDPRAQVLKVTDADGQLIAVALHIGLHGILFDDDNLWGHWDAPGAIAYGLSAALGGTPVLFMQGPAGDMSPAGRGPTAWARAEDLARAAGRRLAPLVEATVVSGAPLTLNPSGLAVPQSHSVMRVTRGGTANFRYAPVSLDEYGESREVPDNRTHDDEGRLIELIDEFPAPLGAGLCGDGIGVPFGSIGMGLAGVSINPYAQCARADKLITMIADMYEVDSNLWQGGTAAEPHNVEPGMSHSLVGFVGLNPLPITTVSRFDNSVNSSSGRVGMLFLPGETTTLLSLGAMGRLATLGYDASFVVGYAQDHEGYLLTIDDWLTGGYEPSINLWGPLQGEYLTEAALTLAGRAVDDHRVRTDDLNPSPADYSVPLGFEPLPETRHLTPAAGEQVRAWPADGLLLPLHISRDAVDPTAPPTSVRALTDLYAVAFEGGDVSVDQPTVRLQRAVDDGFADVVGADGWSIDADGHAVLLGYTPSPTRPEGRSDLRQHYWTLVWQPVGEGVAPGAWADIAPGRYRFAVSGTRVDGAGVVAYDQGLEPFDVVATEIVATVVEGADRAELAYLPAPSGFRLRADDVDPTEASPLPTGMAVHFICVDAGVVSCEGDLVVGQAGVVSTSDLLGASCTLTDPHGNAATLLLE